MWKRNVRREARGAAERLAFMDLDHHRVRNFVVTEVARTGAVAPASIVEALEIDAVRVGAILDDLEAHLTFLYRREGTDVDWAYPVTSEETPHRVRLDSGERFFAA